MYFIIGLLWIVSQNAKSQELYYYYNKEKQYLELNTQYAYLLCKQEPTKSDMVTIGDAKTTIQKIDKSKYNTNEYYCVEIEFASEQSESKYFESLAQLRKTPHIVASVPYFKNKDSQKLRQSHTFYAKVKSIKDSALLASEAKKVGSVIVGRSQLMPEWFVLSCQEGATSCILDMANRLQETNLFDFVEPEFIGIKEDKKIINPDITPNEAITKKGINAYCAPDPMFYEQWGLENRGQTSWNGGQGIANIDIKACRAWDHSKGRDVRIAILSGNFPDATHPDFQGNILSQSYNAPTGTSPSTRTEWDFIGTGVAGVIGALQNNYGITGVAPQCKMMHVNVWNIARVINLAEGITWAWDVGKADIINVDEFGFYYSFSSSSLLDMAVANAATYGRSGKGTIIVSPTGNSVNTGGTLVNILNPNLLSKVLSVGLINPDGTLVGYYGPNTDLVAPTSFILSYGDSINMAYYGTAYGDFAPAYVSGVAALVLQDNQDLSGEQVRNIIKSTAQKIRTDIYSYNNNKSQGTWDDKVGYGLVNAYDAVRKASCLLQTVTGTCTTVPNTTWNSQQALGGVFYVRNGHTLKITSVVQCSDNTRIVVERGGRLILDGGVLTSCKKTWLGIELEPSYSSTAAGWLSMSNGAVIENAETGVLTQNDMGPLYIFQAGRVTAVNSTFRNCERAVDINVYCPDFVSNTSLPSYFYKCTFELTPNWPYSIIWGDFNLKSFVRLTYAKDVSFNGCTFSDNRPGMPNSWYGYNGILSDCSKYTVGEYCDTYYSTPQPTCNGVRSVFQNLALGIYAIDANNPINTIWIDNTDFHSYGKSDILLEGCSNLKITSNNFYLRPNSTGDGQTEALMLFACENYKVEANNLYAQNFPSTSNILGLYVENSHAKNEVIYRNSFNNYNTGICARGKNKYYSTNPNPAYIYDGLQLQCNTFSNYATRNIVVSSLTLGNKDGIALNQGSSSEPAGNKFYNNGATQIATSNTAFNYYYTNTAP